MIFDKYYDNSPIRKVSIACGYLSPNTGIQLNIFDSFKEIKEYEEINIAIDEIKNRYGKNSILKASSLLPDSTIRERNGKIGGHAA